MKTRVTTWLAQIAVVLALLAAGSASASSGFLAGNSCRGKNILEGGFYQGSASVSAETGRGYADFCHEEAADSVVAPTTGATSRLVPGGGLAAHEAAGGHTIARHVGMTDAQLAARLAAEPGISGASSFTSRAVAESAIAQTLDANQAAINTWLQGSSNQLVLQQTLGETVGRSLPRGAASASDVSSVRVVLRRDSSLPTGYRIHTAYPEP